MIPLFSAVTVGVLLLMLSCGYIWLIVNSDAPIRRSLGVLRVLFRPQVLWHILIANQEDSSRKAACKKVSGQVWQIIILGLVFGAVIFICCGMVFVYIESFTPSAFFSTMFPVGIITAAGISTILRNILIPMREINKYLNREHAAILHLAQSTPPLERSQRILMIIIALTSIVVFTISHASGVGNNTPSESELSVTSIIAIALLFAVLAVWHFKSLFEKRKRYLNSDKHIDVRELEENLSACEIDGKPLSQMMTDICAQQGINDVKFIVDLTEAKEKCFCEQDLWETPRITISQGCLEALHTDFDDGQLAKRTVYLLAHELCHLYHKDTRWVRWRAIIARLTDMPVLMLVGLVTIAGINTSSHLQNPVLALTTMLAILLLILAYGLIGSLWIGRVIFDPRYWKGIAELRADRKALDWTGFSQELATSTFESRAIVEKENEEIAAFKTKHPIYKFERHLNAKVLHPLPSFRKEFLAKEWSLLSYVHYFQQVKRRGWLGYSDWSNIFDANKG